MGEMKELREMRLALLGFGNAGQAFGKLLLEKHDKIAEKYGVDVKIAAIATNSKGNLVSEACKGGSGKGEACIGGSGKGEACKGEACKGGRGIDLKEALADIESSGKFSAGRGLSDMSTMDIVEKVDYDVLIEMTPLNIFTGQPAIDHIAGALSREKHAITANKGPIAWNYRNLSDMAKKAGVCFFFETTVMDGTPVFNLVEHTLKMAEVTEVSGILNSTTNFILEEMAAGTDYDEIMEKGRSLGFVEADPAMDIEGYDAAAKITALLNVLMDADITPDMVDRKGIEDITTEDIEKAAAKGKVIKLLCEGKRDEDGNVKASVKPVEVSERDLLATVNGTTSVVSITTDLMKKISVVEHEPEIEQTAYGVFGDLLRVLETDW